MLMRFIAPMALLLSACAAPASAQMGAEATDIKILVLPDDSFVDSLKGSSSISDSIETAIKEQFSRYQYDVKGKAQLAGHPELRQQFAPNLSTGDLLVIAERAKAVKDANLNGVRALVVYKAFPDLQTDRTGSSMTIEISGEVHDLDARRYIGNFGPVRSRAIPVSASCAERAPEDRGRCISALARENAFDLAAMIAEEARIKLAFLTKAGFGQAPAPMPVAETTATAAVPDAVATQRPPVRSGGLITSYSMRFENLSMPEVLRIKGIMEGEFPDYIRTERFSGSPPLVQFGYVSKAPQDKMIEWMYILLNDMGLRAPAVAIRADGSNVIVKRLTSDLPPAPAPAAGGRFR